MSVKQVMTVITLPTPDQLAGDGQAVVRSAVPDHRWTNRAYPVPQFIAA